MVPAEKPRTIKVLTPKTATGAHTGTSSTAAARFPLDRIVLSVLRRKGPAQFFLSARLPRLGGYKSWILETGSAAIERPPRGDYWSPAWRQHPTSRVSVSAQPRGTNTLHPCASA